MFGLSFIFGFFYGFIFGFISKYTYSLYKKYNEYKDVKKLAINKMYNIISDRIFDLLYDEINKNNKNNGDFKINGLENLYDIQELIISFEQIIKNHNDKFKISFIDNQCKIKLLDKNYMNNEHFIRVCKFFTKNNIDLSIIIYETQQNNIMVSNNITENNMIEDIKTTQKIE